jgi:uncharacterized membrane protein YgcG
MKNPEKYDSFEKIDIKDNVNDFAGLLSKRFERKIDYAIKSIECRSDAEIAVVTIDSLQGRDIEEASKELFDKFGIGKKGLNNGILILIAKKDNKYRIEVGDGLEDLIDDELEKDLKNRLITPYFKKGEFGLGILKFINVTAGKIYRDRSSRIAIASLILGIISVIATVVGIVVSALLAFNSYIDIYSKTTVGLLFLNVFIPAAGTAVASIIAGTVDISGMKSGMFIETKLGKSISGILLGALSLISLLLIYYLFSDFILLLANIFNITSVSF